MHEVQCNSAGWNIKTPTVYVTNPTPCSLFSTDPFLRLILECIYAFNVLIYYTCMYWYI